MAAVQNDPDRVTHPLRRRPTGRFERVSWDDALDDIGSRLRRILDRHDPRAVGWYLGNPSAFSYSHPIWVKGFMDAIGSPNLYSAGSQDVNNRFVASQLLYGSPLVVPIPDLARTDLLLIVGANPLVSHGSVLTAPRIKDSLHAIVARGGRVVVVDPRRSETARAFEHVADPTRRRRLAAAVAAAGDLRRGARGRRRASARQARGRRRAARARRRAIRPRRPRREPASPAEAMRTLARDLATRRAGGGLRPHRLLSRPPRHARRRSCSTR